MRACWAPRADQEADNRKGLMGLECSRQNAQDGWTCLLNRHCPRSDTQASARAEWGYRMAISNLERGRLSHTIEPGDGQFR